MKRRYLWTIPFVVLLFMIGVHMFFNFSPLQSEYEKAVFQAEQIRENGYEEKEALVVTMYDYTSTPNMGSPYGVDVAVPVRDPDGNHRGMEYAWIAMESKPVFGEKIPVLVSPDIPNTAVHAEHDLIPHERPDHRVFAVMVLLLLTPLFYVFSEVCISLCYWIFGRKRTPRRIDHAIDYRASLPVIALGSFWLITSFFSLSEYNQAGERIASAREQNNPLLVLVDEECSQPVGCDDRLSAHYEIEGVNYQRSFAIKGELIREGKPSANNVTGNPDTYIPLLVNKNDPRFSYALSSSEQVEPRYDTLRFVAGPALISFGILLLIASALGRRTSPRMNPILREW